MAQKYNFLLQAVSKALHFCYNNQSYAAWWALGEALIGYLKTMNFICATTYFRICFDARSLVTPTDVRT